MGIDIKKVDAKISMLDMVMGIAVDKKDDGHSVSLEVASDKVKGSLNLDIKEIQEEKPQ